MNELYQKYVGLIFDNRYRIETFIGVGGMAIVFKATDLLMRRIVAVKILKDEISGDEAAVKRFINESKAVAMLSHPNIVSIYDVSVKANVKYIVMEFVEGITLKNYMEHREVLNLREIISYTVQILRALEHAHSKGIVHRDIKPQNIMLLKNGVIKVMDFGIAKLPDADSVTMTDKAVGTVYYISPEQATGSSGIDCRSDLYSLGAMMYEMAAGQLPFSGDTPLAVVMKQINDNPEPPRTINTNIPVGLEQIILKAMQKSPDDRYQSATEMLENLTKLRENPKIVFKEKKTAVGKKKVKKNKKHASRTMFPIILGVTLAFLIAAGIAGYYVLNTLFFNSTMNEYKSVSVEKFIGSTYSEELSEWFENSDTYSVPTVTYVYSDTVEKGRIVSQDPGPEENRKVLPGKQMIDMALEVSLGKRTIILEDYTVRDYRVVETELRKLGLKVSAENVTSEVYEVGYVIKTEPEAGEVMHENDVVKIYISLGADSQKTMVPNFVGYNEAYSLILTMEYNLKIGSVKYVKSWEPTGTVLKQNLEAWHEVALYSAVDFEVSGGWNYYGDGTTLPTKDMYYSTTTTQAETAPTTNTDTDKTAVDTTATDTGTTDTGTTDTWDSTDTGTSDTDYESEYEWSYKDPAAYEDPNYGNYEPGIADTWSDDTWDDGSEDGGVAIFKGDGFDWD